MIHETEVEQAQLETMLRAAPAQRLAWPEEALGDAMLNGRCPTDISDALQVFPLLQ